MTRKLALIGTGASGAEAPFEDKSYEIWGVASRFEYVTRADRWFELHRLAGEPEEFQRNWRKSIRKFSSELDLYMLYPENDLGPNVKAYPYQHIVDRFGTYFMTSSFSWMLAMAIDELRPQNGEPVDGEIGIWGVDMEYGTEYRQQRAGFRHFIDVARILGIQVTRFADSGLSFEPIPYPLWQDDPLLSKIKKRKKETLSKLAGLEEALRHTRTMIAQNRMAIDELSRVNPDTVKQRINELEDELDRLMATSEAMSRDFVHNTALEEEQSYWFDYITP